MATVESTTAAVKSVKVGLEEATETKSVPIRMTLCSTKVKAVEQGIVQKELKLKCNFLACRDIIAQAAKKGVKVRGPARMPTKHLRITTRKTPCGEGSKTWDSFEMCIHKRVIDFTCTMLGMREITALKIEPGVDVEVTVASQ